MTIWRPHQTIRVKSIGLHWRGQRLLAVEVEDDFGAIKGVRPIGGTVEFGETWQSALICEFKEELGANVDIVGEPIVLENIYEHHGSIGHEIIFAAEINFIDDHCDNKECIEFQEDSGVQCTARWFDIEQLDVGELALFPSGLKRRLL